MEFAPRGVLTRRGLLKAGTALASGSLLPVQAVSGSGGGKLNTAVIGIGERGKYLIGNLPESFRVTAVCDCSLAQIESLRQPAERFENILDRFVRTDLKTCRVFQDYRRMLSEERFDAVIISAPDHHHALAAILAMKAGAHVYVEKPLALTIAEGRAICDSARRYRRVVQVGSQQRSMQVNRTACQFLRDGGLGKITKVEERNYPGPLPFGSITFPSQSVPDTLDWDLFCGPTPLRPYNKNLWIKDAYKFGFLTWRGWDLFEDYSGHLMTNWGAHSIDMIQYALGTDGDGPTEIELDRSKINAFADDQWHEKTPPLGTIPDKAIDQARFRPLVMRYAGGTEIHFLPGSRKTVFHGEKGTLSLSRNDYSVEPRGLLDPPDPDEKAKWDGRGHVARPHLQNWLDAIQGRAQLHAPIEVGHRTATICHLANIARRLGRDLKWDPTSETFVGDDAANQLVSRTRRAGFELPG